MTLLLLTAILRPLGRPSAAPPGFWGPIPYRPDVNRCPAHRLLLVTGIGPKRALAIVEERERGGPFRDFADVGRRVHGIGPVLARQLEAEGFLTVRHDPVERFE